MALHLFQRILYICIGQGLMQRNIHVSPASSLKLCAVRPSSEKVSEYDQEIPQSHTADQPTAP